MNKDKKVVCVIPVFNEADLIEETISSVKRVELIDEIIVVNDGSTDETLKVVESLNLKYISYDKNRGKGFAIKKAIEDLDYSHLVLLDGDLGESSNEINKLIKASLENEESFVVARFPEAKTVTNKKGGFGLVKNLARRGVKFFTGIETNTSLSGQRVYTKENLKTIDYIPDRYGIEVAMTIQSLNNGFKLKEIDVNMTHRYTERNLSGFIHRGKQFKDILKTFIIMYFKGYKG